MNEIDEKKKKEIALFKYGLISPVLVGNVAVQVKYFREMARKEHDVPYLGKKRYKAGTFKKWLKLYRRWGFNALVPKEREDKGQSRKINSQLAIDIKGAVASYPFLSGSALYRLLVSEGKIRLGGINEGTLRKYIKDKQLRESIPPVGRKKFEKEHINELWTADCMHGPYLNMANPARKHKVFLIAAIDDHSRMICARGWFGHENSIALEQALKEGFSRFGLPQTLYCDNGSIFSNSHLQLACAQLGIALIHSKPYDSPSRGKIERFFRTVRAKFLSTLQIREINDLEQLNSQFEQWLEKEYHKHLHSGIEETPMDRFMRDFKQAAIKRVSLEELDTAFQMTIYRKVKNDATVSVKGDLYQCPPQFIGKKIQLRHPSHKPQELTIYHNDKPLSAIKKVNPHENATPPAWGISFTENQENNND
ncbi:MAG: DDE-type integrase/transposase/recombinase [Desulfobacteraceae bacterium]|jgi:transposase InsO family protein